MRLYPRTKRNGAIVWWASWTENKVTVRRSTRQATRDLAKLVTNRWARERADPELEKARQATLGDEATAFMRECKTAKLAPGTIQMYEQKLANVCDVLGRDTSMANIDADCIFRYFELRESEGAAASTQYKEWIALSGVLKLARHKGRFAREVRALKPPRLTADYTPRKRWLTWEQADTLLEEIGTLQFPTLRRRDVGPADRRRTVAFVLATGARLGEWMRAGHVPGIVDIDRKRGVVHIHGTKTDGADQEIPIPSPMRRWIDIAGDPPFPRWSNGRRDILAACERIETRLVTAWERAGSAGPRPSFPGVTWNDLRRTFISLLLQAGVPPHILKHLSRHKTTRMIDLVYGQQTTASVGALVENALTKNRDPSVNQHRRTKTNRRARRNAR